MDISFNSPIDLLVRWYLLHFVIKEAELQR